MTRVDAVATEGPALRAGTGSGLRIAGWAGIAGPVLFTITLPGAGDGAPRLRSAAASGQRARGRTVRLGPADQLRRLRSADDRLRRGHPSGPEDDPAGDRRTDPVRRLRRGCAGRGRVPVATGRRRAGLRPRRPLRCRVHVLPHQCGRRSWSCPGGSPRIRRGRGLAGWTLAAGIACLVGFVVMGSLVIPDDAPLHDWAGLGQRVDRPAGPVPRTDRALDPAAEDRAMRSRRRTAPQETSPHGRAPRGL